MAATATKHVPLVSSSMKGPLGAAHLPRLWLKLSLGANGSLADGYDECGQGFDQMTMDALGLDRDKTIAYVREKHPTYMQFEQYVKDQNGGSISHEKIEAHNKAIHGYHHADELGGKMRAASGCTDANVKDAVMLNQLEDLDEFHHNLHHGH